MKKNNKKGFTIVELVIVIAVIAILAAVLIPTFSSIIKKAKISNDTVLAKNLTTAIATESITSKPTSMEEVVTKLYNAGFVLENLSPTTEDYFYGWDSKNNQIILISDKYSVVYESAKSTPVDVYVATTGEFAQKLANAGYSLYLTTEATTVDTTNFINVDTGNTKLGTLKMTASTATEVTLKGTIGSVTVNNGNGVVRQYASVKTLTVENIAMSSYHVYGAVENATLKAGKLEVEQLGEIKNLNVTAVSVSTVNVVNKGVIESATLPEGILSEVSTGKPSEEKPHNITIGNYAELVAFRDQVNSGRHFENVVVTLTADIDISGRSWTPIGAGARKDDRIYFAGIFDGANHTIKGLTNKGMDIGSIDYNNNNTTPKNVQEVAYGFFGIIKNATIKNLKMSNVDIELVKVVDKQGKTILGDSVGAIAGHAYGDSVEISNCHVLSGKVAGFDAVAGILGRTYAKKLEDKTIADKASIVNCSNAATVTSSRRAAGIVGYSYEANVTDCVNTGNVTCLNNEKDYGILTDVDDKGNDRNINAGYHAAAGIVNFSTSTKVEGNANYVLTNNSSTGTVSVSKVLCSQAYSGEVYTDKTTVIRFAHTV
ncbi:MAG: type II secretion system GspH family protein [Clostridiales bacterium]|nr:type II secretion system GspH family protein [Clostridiales bacterium]